MDDTQSAWELGVAGAFTGAKSAFEAILALREAGFTRTWVGFFKPSPTGAVPVLDAEWEGNPSEAFGVFPMRHGQPRSLFDVLRCRGRPGDECARPRPLGSGDEHRRRRRCREARRRSRGTPRTVWRTAGVMPVE